MLALDAFDQAGLEPGGVDPGDSQTTWGSSGVYSTDAYSTGEAALLVHEAKQLLDWRDLVFSVAMHGLNSSVTPLSAVPQRIERPYPYANWQAERLLAVLGDSYLFDLEFEIVNGELEGFPRLLQDPLSFRNYPWRGGSAWKAWDQLEKLVVTAMNTSDHNPSTAPGVRPKDSPSSRRRGSCATTWSRRPRTRPTRVGERGWIHPFELQLPPVGAGQRRRAPDAGQCHAPGLPARAPDQRAVLLGDQAGGRAQPEARAGCPAGRRGRGAAGSVRRAQRTHHPDPTRPRLPTGVARRGGPGRALESPRRGSPSIRRSA